MKSVLKNFFKGFFANQELRTGEKVTWDLKTEGGLFWAKEFGKRTFFVNDVEVEEGVPLVTLSDEKGVSIKDSPINDPFFDAPRAFPIGFLKRI
jgi:hypothetical protein